MKIPVTKFRLLVFVACCPAVMPALMTGLMRGNHQHHNNHPPQTQPLRCENGSAVEASTHIIIIMVDDLGLEDLGYRGSIVQTPNIDALASEAVHLEKFVAYSWCAPSRMAFLTGRDPHVELMASTFEAHRKFNLCCGKSPVLPPATMLPAMLRNRGYRTSLVGKFHFPEQVCLASKFISGKRATPDSRLLGWDSFVGFYGGVCDHWNRENWVLEDGSQAPDPGKDSEHTTDYIARAAVDVISSHSKEQPLFLWASFTAPHTPHQAPWELVQKYVSLIKTTDGIEIEILESIPRYLAMIEQVDSGVGKIVESLKQQSMFHDSLIVFMSDNGGVYSTPFCNGRLRGGKGLGYEGGVRVPFFVTWPRCFGNSRRRDIADRVFRIEDLFASLLSLTFREVDPSNSNSGTAVPSAWDRWVQEVKQISPDSLPFFDVFSSKWESTDHRETVAARQEGRVEEAAGVFANDRRVRWPELGSHSFAVQRGRYKLVQSLAVWASDEDIYPRVKMKPRPPKTTRFLELFDLANDPFERVNILARFEMATAAAGIDGNVSSVSLDLPTQKSHTRNHDRHALEALWGLVMSRGRGLGENEKPLVPGRGWWYKQVLIAVRNGHDERSAARQEQMKMVCAAGHATKDREMQRHSVLDDASRTPPATLARCQNAKSKKEVPLFESGWCFSF